MGRTEKLSRYMNEHHDEFTALLEEAVILESPTQGEKNDLAACRDFFSNLFAQIGFACTVVPSEDVRYGDHLLMEYGTGENQVLFVGHYDTVYPKGSFEPLWKIDGRKAFGPGVLDMKGGDIQVYMICKAFIDLGLLPQDSKIVFFLSSDEETGSLSSQRHYEYHAKRSKAAFVMESAKGDYIGGAKIGRFGRGVYSFFAHGTQAHSGLEPSRAESGLRELAKQAVRLEDLTFYDKNNETLTVACTCLESGNAIWPTVPGDGKLTIDVRYSSEQLANTYDAFFKNLTSFNPKVRVETKGGINKPPFDKENIGNKALYKRAIEVAARLGIELKGEVVMGGSDGNFTSAVGCPTLDGLGMTGDFVHNPKEYINLDCVPPRGAMVAELALRTLEG